MVKRILYCVLDWGLGHATRSIPIISLLLENSCEVQIASDGQALAFLKRRFPDLTFHELIGYGASYPTNSLYLNMLSMAYRLQKAIETERQQIDEIVRRYHPEIIISDNRYGCFHRSAQSILISHQLRLPVSNILEQRSANFLLDKKLKPFAELWVPDHMPPDHLTGRMAELDDERVKYIGPLSSMSRTGHAKQDKRLLILLSGPEPARSKFENKLLDLELFQYFQCQLIRGSKLPLNMLSRNIEVVDMATVEEVSEAISMAAIIICRSGYSTIMDLLKLNKKAIYIPTPGQPEQDYLANVISEKRKGIRLDEEQLSIDSMLAAVEQLEQLDDFNDSNPAKYHAHVNRILTEKIN